MNLALTYYMLKDDWNAQLYFSELLNLNANDTIALNYLGELSFRDEDLEEAEKYSREIDRNPKRSRNRVKAEQITEGKKSVRQL